MYLYLVYECFLQYSYCKKYDRTQDQVTLLTMFPVFWITDIHTHIPYVTQAHGSLYIYIYFVFNRSVS